MREEQAMTRTFDGWGGWTLDGVWLEYPAYAAATYPVQITDLRSSAAMLDLIMQVRGKSWADDACLAGLVRALDDIFQPQAHLCSGGQNLIMEAKAIAGLAKATGQGGPWRQRVSRALADLLDTGRNKP
jgi:hypothetical protein